MSRSERARRATLVAVLALLGAAAACNDDFLTESPKDIIVADNLYMYGPINAPIRETSPQEPQSKKGRLRKQLAASLLDAA